MKFAALIYTIGKAMKFTITDPLTGMPVLLEARPQSFHHEPGFRIIYPNGSGFFICNKFGTWHAADDHHVDPDLLVQIGLAIEHCHEDNVI